MRLTWTEDASPRRTPVPSKTGIRQRLVAHREGPVINEIERLNYTAHRHSIIGYLSLAEFEKKARLA
ncbi:hypothetical protein BIWAKO_06805 [Bosea sp. BIWAKO-01]|nr:hypothetical protein BIWAKO_06805 [Bosea sp. BIWAKO-01]